MLLGNLPPYLGSKIVNARLVLLCREKDLKLFGWDIFLEKLIDLIILETIGIQILVEEQEMTFKGTVVFTLGDNLGSHDIGGFTENFSKAAYFCRFCEIDRQQFLSKDWSNITYRTPDSYNECVGKHLNKIQWIKV